MIINDNGIEREASEAEITYYKKWQTDIENKTKSETKAETERAIAKQAVLDRLGITADEAALLLG